jgi:hypothetical protein
MTDHDRDRSSGKRSNQRADGRVPPHNLDAEESSIGAALISPAAAATIVERLEPGDYYKPAHQHAFRAIRSVVAAGSHVDVVTVADELRRAGLLDEVGGAAYLHELQNATPSVSAAGHYAKIVRDCALLRRMLYAAADIAEAAYSNAEPAEAVARAQDALVALAVDGDPEGGSSLDVADLAALLDTDLEPESGTFLTRTDGTSLLYAGKMHVFQAEPSSGKSWIALHIVREALDLGGSALYLDHEDTPGGILRRLRNLGCPADAMRDRLVYARPAGRYGAAERLQIDRILERLNPDLVVIDGVGESLSRNGLSEDKADDVLRWFDLLPRPIAATGAAVLMIDHVAKDPEQRGRWARGSGAKLGAVDGASFQVKVLTPFSRHRAGAVKLVVAKDRPGQFSIGETAALVKIEPHAAGERVVLTVEPDGADLAITDTHKPTQVMAMIAAEIESTKVPLTPKALEHLVHAKPRTIHEALARLIAEGYVTQGTGRIKTLRLLRPYHPTTSRPEPPPVEEPPPELFDYVPEEPEWLTEERQQLRDARLRAANDNGGPDA